MRCRFAIFVNPWEPYELLHPRGALPIRVLALYIEPSWMVSLDRRLGAGIASCASTGLEISSVIDERLRMLADLAMYGSLPSGDGAWFAETILELFWSSFRICPGGAPASDFRIRRALELFQLDPASGVSLDDMARRVGLSRGHFFAQFRAQTGCTPGLVLGGLRMEAAYAEILGSTLPLREVSAKLGFTAPSNFTRFFRNNFGATPAGFRSVAHRLSL